MNYGLFSESIIKEEVKTLKIRYTVPLRRSSTIVQKKARFNSAFLYGERAIYASMKSSGLDCAHTFCDRLSSGKGRIIHSQGHCTLKDRHGILRRQEVLESFSIMSNLDQEPKHTYSQYKSREEVE
ncbi:MAG: hypothetical protein QW292_07275 [Candidatus Parvarchaeota archaeon]